MNYSQNKILFNRYIIDKNKIAVYDIIDKEYLQPYKNSNKFYLKEIKKIYSYRQLYKLAYNELFIIDNIADLPQEEWIQIYNTNYYVSNKGRIKSYYYYTAELIKLQDKKGYYTIKIKGKHYSIHRLVIEYFNKNISPIGYEVHHKDHNKKNNCIDNLIYLSKEQHRKIEAEYRKSKRKVK